MVRRTLSSWRAPAAALVVLGMLTLGQGAAVADGDPVGDLTKKVQKQAAPVTGAVAPKQHSPARASTPSSPPGEPANQDETAPNEVEDPTTPDHAGSEVLHTEAAGEPVGDFSKNRSEVQDDDSTKSDSTLLAVGGMEIVGAHADSSGNQHDSAVDFDEVSDPVCEQSDEAFCADILYADANATDDGRRSHSDGSSGVFRACIGGDGEPTDCQAPAQAEVGGSATQADRDQRTGRTTASSSSSLAELCLVEGPLGLPTEIPGLEGDGCSLGFTALESQGQSDSGGESSSASRQSSIGGVTVLGQEADADSLPAGCDPATPIGTTLVCAYTNQGETYLGDGTAGHAQEALKAQVLPGAVASVTAGPQDLLNLVAGRTETLVHNDGGEPAVAPHPRSPAHVKAAGAARAPATVVGQEAQEGLLPNTGGVWSGLLSGGLLALGAGAMLVAASRRRQLVPLPA